MSWRNPIVNKKERKKLFVSHNWNDKEVYPDCSLCSAEIEPKRGDYIFQLFVKRNRSDAAYICKQCAVTLQAGKEKVKTVFDSPFKTMIQIRNTYWKPQ
jgi:hypothetical protein